MMIDHISSSQKMYKKWLYNLTASLLQLLLQFEVAWTKHSIFTYLSSKCSKLGFSQKTTFSQKYRFNTHRYM